MSKHRKTRKEKIIADLRHQLYTVKTQNFSLQKPAIKPIATQEQPIRQVENKNTNISTAVINLYPYLKHDVLKTLILTLFIIAFQIALLFVLKKHLISLPGLHY